MAYLNGTATRVVDDQFPGCRVAETADDGTAAIVVLEHEVADQAARNTFRVPAGAVIQARTEP
ncbi:hypothetical protein [Amycolatopsis sp. NPDC054798]